MASLLTADIAALLTMGTVRPIVRKKAALALLRMLRKSADNAEDILPPEVRSGQGGALPDRPQTDKACFERMLRGSVECFGSAAG